MIARIIMRRITLGKALIVLAIMQKMEFNNYYFIVHLRICKNKDAYKKLNMLH